jgi:hypothetical protein
MGCLVEFVDSTATTGSLSGTINALAASTSYTCYVVAYANAAGTGTSACSSSTADITLVGSPVTVE